MQWQGIHRICRLCMPTLQLYSLKNNGLDFAKLVHNEEFCSKSYIERTCFKISIVQLFSPLNNYLLSLFDLPKNHMGILSETKKGLRVAVQLLKKLHNFNFLNQVES